MNLLEKVDKKSEISLDDILNSDYSFNEEEINFIIKEKQIEKKGRYNESLL